LYEDKIFIDFPKDNFEGKMILLYTLHTAVMKKEVNAEIC